MRVVGYMPNAPDFRLIASEGEDLSMLLGYKKKSGDVAYTVENNLVNRIVLSLPLPVYEPVELIHGHGLEEYQYKDVQRMVQTPYLLNANKMGLGKTVETIYALRELNVDNALIIVPKTIMIQWKEQIGKFWPQMYDRTDVLPSKFKADRIAIVNYEKLLNVQTHLKLREFQWQVLIPDEAHRIKNRGSQRTIKIKEIPAANKWPLTGTPILNRVDDLWSILDFMHWSYGGKSYWNFVNYFCKVSKGFSIEIKGLTDDENKIAVLNKLRSIVAIRNPISVTQGKRVVPVTLEMGRDQRKLYDQVKNLVLDELSEKVTIPNGAVHALRLQQATSWPGLFVDDLCGIKFEWINEFLDDNPEEKLVIFSRFAQTAKALQRFLGTKRCAIYIGEGMSTLDREEQKRFFIDGHARAIVGTISAMGQGVDGLQFVSRTGVFIDRDWSPEINEQAEDRIDRRGQQYPVMIYDLQCIKSFDKHVGNVNLTKAEDIRRVLQDERV